MKIINCLSFRFVSFSRLSVFLSSTGICSKDDCYISSYFVYDALSLSPPSFYIMLNVDCNEMMMMMMTVLVLVFLRRRNVEILSFCFYLILLPFCHISPAFSIWLYLYMYGYGVMTSLKCYTHPISHFNPFTRITKIKHKEYYFNRFPSVNNLITNHTHTHTPTPRMIKTTPQKINHTLHFIRHFTVQLSELFAFNHLRDKHCFYNSLNFNSNGLWWRFLIKLFSSFKKDGKGVFSFKIHTETVKRRESTLSSFNAPREWENTPKQS